LTARRIGFDPIRGKGSSAVIDSPGRGGPPLPVARTGRRPTRTACPYALRSPLLPRPPKPIRPRIQKCVQRLLHRRANHLVQLLANTTLVDLHDRPRHRLHPTSRPYSCILGWFPFSPQRPRSSRLYQPPSIKPNTNVRKIGYAISIIITGSVGGWPMLRPVARPSFALPTPTTNTSSVLAHNFHPKAHNGKKSKGKPLRSRPSS